MVEHSLNSLIGERVTGLALGYVHLNDHDHLRHDPLIATLVEKADPTQPLAGNSTLNRLEMTPEGNGGDRYKRIVYDDEAIDRSFVNVF
jgi:Transposase DDE domain group 1